MRNKFTELIEQGVASFNYTNISREVPEQDPICRFYNNVFSIPTNTHMSCLDDGETRVITGHMIATPKWDEFLCASNWGAVNFRTSGVWCLCDFLCKYNLQGELYEMNGDVVYKVTKKPEEQLKIELPKSYTTTESKIPQPLAQLTTNCDVNKIKECFQSNNIVKSLNESLYIKGENWIEYNGKIIGLVENNVIII